MLNRKSNSRRDPQDINSLRLPEAAEYPFAVVPPVFGDGDGYDGDEGGNEACRLVAVNLSAYLDGELDADQQRVVEAHLDHCAQCTAALDTLEITDTLIEREWRDNAPLPSSSEVKSSIDSIMAALPPAPVSTPEFAPKRVHAKARWMRFSTGLAGIIAFAAMLGSSYRMGYVNGRTSSQPAFTPSPSYENPTPRPASNPVYSAPVTLASTSPASQPASLAIASTSNLDTDPPQPPPTSRRLP